MSKLIHRVRSLSERGERISTEDCRDLFQIRDLTALAKLARVPRERRFGTRSFYRTAHVAQYAGENPELFISELDTVAPEDSANLMIRCRWQGGDSLAVWKERFAAFSRGRIPAVAVVSAGFIARLAGYEGLSHADVIQSLRQACPLLLTGEDAELFDRDLRFAQATGVISPEEWVAVHRAAHGLGMKTMAAMTYSTIDHPIEYAAHMDRLRTLQDETGGFAAFVPMALHNSGVKDFYLAVPTAAQTLRAAAISRLYFDNIAHIVAASSLVTLEIAVVALSYGADMVDTVISGDDVHSMEYPAGDGGDLPVFDGSTAIGRLVPPAAKVRDRLAEARWLPTPVDAAFAGAEAVVSV